MNFEAGHRPTASLSIEAKRARNRRNTRNYQLRKRQEKEELEEDVAILEQEFSRIFGEDALKELKHAAQQSEIKAPDELQMQIQKLEDELEDIARRRSLPGTNLITNASQKCRANAALKLAKLEFWKIVLLNGLMELEAELDVDPPRAEAYGSSAAIKTNSADDRSYNTDTCPNPSLECPLKAAQTTENPDFMDMPVLERQEKYRTAEGRRHIPEVVHQTAASLPSFSSDFGPEFNDGSSNDLEELDGDVIDGILTASTGISTNVNSETTKLRQRRQTINSYRIEDRLHLAPLKKRQRTDVSGGTINLFDDHVIYNDPKITNSPSPHYTGTLHNLTSTKQVLEGHSKAEDSSSNVRNYLSNNSHSNTPGGWQRKQMALNGTTLQHTHDRFLFEWSHGTYTATGSHDFFGETRYEPSKMKIRSTPTPLNTAQQQPVSPTEQFFADRSYGRWIGKEGPSPSTPPPRPLNNPQLVPVPPMEQLCEDLSDGRTWIRANEPSPNRNHTTAAMLNTAQQQPVTPTEQFFEDRSYDGTRIRAQVPSPASSFDSGELAEDYWEPDWPAPTNDAGSPTEDRLEPDWSPAMEPDPTAPTATETAQERWDHWPADKQEL